MNKVFKCFFFLLVIVIYLSSCQKNSGTAWDAGILAPLASTNLTLSNLVKDTILHTNPDSSLSISYQNTVYELSLADQYIHIPDTSIGQKYTIDSLLLPNISIYYKISLGTMAKNMIANGQPLLGYYLLNQNGHMDSLPLVTGLTLSPFYFDASAFYQSATLADDRISFNVDNHLPVAIQNVTYELRNAISNTLLLSGTMPYIAPGASYYQDFRLQGVTIESRMKLTVTSFTIPGTGGNLVLIDTSNYVGIGAYIDNIKLDSAVARFPGQDIVSKNQELTQNIGDRKFTYVDCKEGTLKVAITSAVHQPLHLLYKLVGAYDKNGNPLTATSFVPAATGGQLSTINQNYDLSGFAINLTGANGTKFNTYTQIINAHIDSTGALTSISSSDSIHIQYFLQNIKPNYIKGYAGRDTIHFSGSTPFSVINMFGNSSANALMFNRASMTVSIDNGIGIDGNVMINNLTSVNASGASVTLSDHSANPVIGRSLYIGRARDFPLVPAVSTFNISSTTSNITDFLNNLPNKINYDVLIKTNPSGNRGTYDDFAYLDSKMKVNLSVNIPLSFIANNLTLLDSFNFTLGYSQKDVANIKDGTLHLLIDNKFPLQANITLLAYDNNWHLLDTLLSNAQINAAHLNSSCRADQAVRSILDVHADAALIDKIRNVAHAVLRVTFNTKSSNAICNGQYLNIYSDYNIDAKITADFNYKVKF